MCSEISKLDLKIEELLYLLPLRSAPPPSGARTRPRPPEGWWAGTGTLGAGGGQGGLGAQGRRMWRRMSWLLGGTGPGPGPGGRQLLLRLELCGLLHGDALGRHGVIRLGHSSQGHAGAGTGCGWENKFNVQTQTKIFRKNICCSPSPDVGVQHVLSARTVPA